MIVYKCNACGLEVGPAIATRLILCPADLEPNSILSGGAIDLIYGYSHHLCPICTQKVKDTYKVPLRGESYAAKPRDT